MKYTQYYDAAALKQAVIKHLDDAIDITDFRGLRDAARHIDHEVIEFLTESFGGFHTKRSLTESTCHTSSRYSLKAIDTADGRIRISHRSTDRTSKKPEVARCRMVSRSSKYRVCEIAANDESFWNDDVVYEYVTVVLSTAEAWLREKFHIFSQINNSSYVDFYEPLRQQVPNAVATGRVWLATVDENTGFYLPDSGMISSSLRTMEQAKDFPERSRFRLLSGLVTTTFDYQTMFAKSAIANQCQTATFDLPQNRYDPRAGDFVRAATVLYGRSINIVPITSEQSGVLFAVLPGNSPSLAEEIFKCKDSLTRKFRSERQRIRKTRLMLQREDVEDSLTLNPQFTVSLFGFSYSMPADTLFRWLRDKVVCRLKSGKSSAVGGNSE